ncbi:MAG: HD domain-containing protein [Anaerolineales bacterium]|nr:HD domain-containing protein [Anaerolineales bacterium]
MISTLIDLLQHGNQLKRTPRTGWVQRGVPQAENVAAHTFGMAYTALILAPHIDPNMDMGRLLALCLLHDLPEGMTTDVPAPAWKHLPPGVKHDVERGVMRQMVGEGTQAEALMALWDEMDENTTAVAKLVHDADKIDMFLQALMYEQQTGNRQLAEFWAVRHQFYYPLCQEIYDALRDEREQLYV